MGNPTASGDTQVHLTLMPAWGVEDRQGLLWLTLYYIEYQVEPRLQRLHLMSNSVNLGDSILNISAGKE